MQDFTIISYFTENTPYEQVAHDYLMPSVQKFNLKSDIRRVESRGSWNANTSYKAEFVLTMLEMHKSNCVFLDCDAIINSYPQLFHEIPEEFNFGAHTLDRSAWYGSPRNPQYELLTGTAFFRYSEKTLEIVKKWVDECKRTPQIWEQKILENIIKNDDVNIFPLPISYCYIFSLPDNSPPIVKCENPTIVHMQKSRELRQSVK